MKNKNVFISHYGKDDDKVQAFKELMKSKQGHVLRNSSIDSTKPNDAKSEGYIKKLLRDGIKRSGTVVVLIGSQTSTRWWVNWEIEQAAKLGKRIVGVYIQGETTADIPDAFHEHGDALVGWNSGKVVQALNGECNEFDGINGTAWQGKYSIGRSNC